MSDLKQRLQSLTGRTEDELEALGEGMATSSSDSATSQPAAKPKPKAKPLANPMPVKKRDLLDETTRVIVTGLDKRIATARAAGNSAMVAELEARKKDVIAQAQAAKK